MEKPPVAGYSSLPNPMNKLILRMAIACVVLMTPFVINNFVQGRIVIGVIATMIVFIFAVNAWSISKHDRYHPNLILIGLVPAILFFLVVSLKEQGMIGALWCYPAVVSFYFMLPPRKASIATVVLLLVTTPIIVEAFPHAIMLRIVVTLILVAIFSAIFVNVIADQQAMLQSQAVTDALTGVLNRMLFSETLQLAAAQSQRAGTPMTLLAFDLDHFKAINDELGHDAGDLTLKAFATLLKERVRSVDKIFRSGGEEFIVQLFDTTLESGRIVAEDIRRRVESLEVVPGRSISVSVGVATLRGDEDWRQWLKRSDENLYRAKDAGRNRVVAE